MNDLLDKEVCKFLCDAMPHFLELMRYGPAQKLELTPKEKLIEFLVRWALELATLETLSIAFEGS